MADVLVHFVILFSQSTVYLNDTFDGTTIGTRWVHSTIRNDDGSPYYTGQWAIDGSEKSGGLVATEGMRHYALSRNLDQVVNFESTKKPLVVQYDVTFNTQGPVTCGGSYIKLLSVPTSGSTPADLTTIADTTPFTLMFGPDKCGADAKLHFIFRHQSPITLEYREIVAKKISGLHSLLFADKKSHLVTLVVKPDNTFAIKVDLNVILAGALGGPESFNPSLLLPETIDDPLDSKPASWVDDEMINDPEAIKPEEWNDSAEIVDPGAKIPAEWNEDEDGEWEPPTIPNPAYTGLWKPLQLKNPEYKGPWNPKKIVNPEYFEDPNPFSHLAAINAITFELWTTQSGYTFDNLLITDSEEEANEMAAATWSVKRFVQDSAEGSGSWIEWLTTGNLLQMANEQPWLYAVTAMAGFLALFLVCCSDANQLEESGKANVAVDE